MAKILHYNSMIEPKILKGFRDFLPVNELQRKQIIQTLESLFQRFGFLPIDTPVLEYSEVLLGKGSGETDKQLYRFLDNGKRDVALRFDLTVPFARFMAMYHSQLALPFKRYHIAKVWRGENTQKGRYREFMQCDFDIVGVDSIEADFEIINLMYTSFNALKIDDVSFHLSHRQLFNDFLKENNIQVSLIDILRTVDKLDKIGLEAVKDELSKWCTAKQIDTILSFITIKGPLQEALTKVKALLKNESSGLKRLEDIAYLAKAQNIESHFLLNLSITRGLDYYTGIVYETFINRVPQIGSVCSGGRYNNLASLYTKEQLPGVGASIGLDRLLSALDEINNINKNLSTTELMIFNIDESLKAHYFELATALRNIGLKTELFLQTKKIQQQFSYCQKNGIPLAIINGESEYAQKSYQLKNLLTRESHLCSNFKELCDTIKKELQ